MDKQLPMHLAIRPLNLSDLRQVYELEKLCFPSSEAASEETIRYRLTVCPELTSGLFIRTFGGQFNSDVAGQEKSSTDEYNRDYMPDEKSNITEEKLISHIMSTKTPSEFITEEAMEVPLSFTNHEDVVDSKVGHVESAETIGLHSVVVHPNYRGKKIASLILHDYIQKLSNQVVGSVISIIAKPAMLPFYENLGFVNKGISKCTHGGEEWNDMQIALTPEEDKL